MPTRRQIHLPRTRRAKLRLYTAALNALVLAAMLLVLHLWHPPIRIITRTNPRDGAAMVWVRAGKFRMGTTNGQVYRYAWRIGGLPALYDAVRRRWPRYADEQPAHTIYLDGYWIYKYEVTVDQYKRFCKATGRKSPARDFLKWPADQPVTKVNWQDAQAYAAWAGAALPTEAQWEKAFRGTDGRIYPWGNEWDVAKCVTTLSDLKPVGSCPAGASPYGAQDMAGNAGEWCEDWYSPRYYAISPARNPTGPASGTKRLVRRGVWSNDFAIGPIRSTSRDARYPTAKDSYIGFRCIVRTPAP